MEPKYGPDSPAYHSASSTISIAYSANQNVGNAPQGSRFAAYRDTSYRDPRHGTGTFSTPSSSPHLKPVTLQPSHQVPSMQGQHHVGAHHSSATGYGNQIPTNGYTGRGNSSIMYTVEVNSGSAAGAEGYNGTPTINRIRTPPQSEMTNQLALQRMYGREERASDSSNSYDRSMPNSAYATTSRTMMPTTTPSDSASNPHKPLTPRRREVESERYISKAPERSIPEPRLSSDFVRQPNMTAEHDRSHGIQVAEELTNLLKERDKIRSQQPQQSQQQEPSRYPPGDVRTEFARQNGDVVKERDLLRAQFEELSNRYQLLQHSLKVLEEQSSVEHGNLELTAKKLKDAEANASSLQNHQTMLARENQLLKEQLGKVLRLHESEKVMLQSQLQTLDGQLAAAKADTVEVREQNQRMTEQIHANQAVASSHGDALRTTTFFLERLEQTLYGASVKFRNKKECTTKFAAWKDFWLRRKEGLSTFLVRRERNLQKLYLDEWCYQCATATRIEVESLRKELSDLQERTQKAAAEADAQYKQLNTRYEQERKALQMESETLTAIRAEMQNNMAETEALWSRKLEDARLNHEMEVSNLTSRFEQLQSDLCEKLVSSRSSSLEQFEMLRAEQSRNEREWRQKIIDKEKILATHLEDMEKQRMRSIEEIQQELQAKEKDWIMKTDILRAENLKIQEEWRQKLIVKEKELAGKMEAARESHIKAQEEFQAELHEKEKDFKKAMESKEQEFLSIIESRVSNASGSAMKLLQSRLALQDATVREKETQIQVLKGEKLKMQECIDSASVKEHSFATEIEDLRNVVKSRSQGSSTDLSSWISKVAQLEASLQTAERNMNVEKQKSSTLSVELEAASQTMMKRGEEYASTLRLLQGRIDTKDAEIVTLKDKMWDITSGHASLTVEKERSKPSSAFENELQRQINTLQEENRKQQQDWQNRYLDLQSSSQLEISNLKNAEALQSGIERESSSQNRYELELTERLNQTEAELDQLRKFVGSVQQENTTLTNELDNVLFENAQLRQKLDSDHFNEDSKDRLDSPYLGIVHKLATHGSRDLMRSMDGFPSSGSTCGVHTVRLKRDAFEAWLGAVLEIRMWGKNHTFNCLEYLIATDGTPVEWLPVGRVRKGDFEVKGEKIGSGTFAEVLRGELKIPCAVKRTKGAIQHLEILEFVREGEMMRAMNHPNIVRLIGVQAEQGQYHLLQEYVGGSNLFDYLHKYHKRVPIGKQFRIAVQMCDALVYIHQLRIVHRDVKTQNMIYVEKTGVVKLCDFGLARLMPYGVPAIDPKHLGTGGTPAYQGPEVLKRHPVGLKLDLYGFAICLWELYTAKLPWSDCSLDQMTVRVAVQKERPRIPSDMPRDYADLICQCWHDDPNARPEFKNILRPLIDLHDSLNPNSRLTMSASSIASTISGSNGSAEPYSMRSAAFQQRFSAAGATGQPQAPPPPQRFTATIAQF